MLTVYSLALVSFHGGRLLAWLILGFGKGVYDYETNPLTLTRSENVETWNWVQKMARRYPREGLAS